ncbi:hypothetical protein ACNOYE_07900 [Nannocystaceae bacterium ST9]
MNSSNESSAPLIGVRIEQEDLSPDAAAGIEGLDNAAAERSSTRYGTVSSPAEQGRRVLVAVVSPGPFPGDYLVRVEAHFDGELLGETPPQACLACPVAQLVDAIDTAALELVQQFPEPSLEETAEDPQPASSEPTPMDEPMSDRSRRSPLVPTGIGLSVIGVAGLATGIGLIAVHEQAEPNEGQPYIRVVDYRPAGVAVAAVGGAVLITGIALVIVGVKRRQDSRAALAPAFSPEFAGAVVVGRF